MLEVTYSAYLAFYVYLVMLLIQWMVAIFSKAKQPNAIPGKIDSDLSHDSFVFRAHRTFQNTLENSTLFLGSVLLAFSLNYQSAIFATCMWVYVVARILHMVLYYGIATEKNPSPRSYFFLIAAGANVFMLALLGLRLI
jgi:uncharacterized MAPEG superfamily protein